jgi:hypothetical protein
MGDCNIKNWETLVKFCWTAVKMAIPFLKKTERCTSCRMKFSVFVSFVCLLALVVEQGIELRTLCLLGRHYTT